MKRKKDYETGSRTLDNRTDQIEAQDMNFFQQHAIEVKSKRKSGNVAQVIYDNGPQTPAGPPEVGLHKRHDHRKCRKIQCVRQKDTPDIFIQGIKMSKLRMDSFQKA